MENSSRSAEAPPRRHVTPLLLGLALLLAALAVTALFLTTRDTAIYRRAFEQKLSSVLGRSVSIGAVSFELTLPPTVSVRDLRIANPAWASRPDFVTATSGEVRIDLAALWDGRVVLRTVRLGGVDLLLERDPNGEGNWRLDGPGRGDQPAKLPDFNAVSLADARIGWRQGDGRIAQVQVDSAEAVISGGAPFELRAQGRYRDTPMRLAVKGDSSLQTALEGGPWRLAVGLEPEGAALALDVRLASIASIDGLELGIQASGEHLAAWSGLLGQALPAWGPYRLSAQARHGQGGFRVDDLKLSLEGLPVQPPRLEIGTGKIVLASGADTQLTAEGRLGAAPFSLQLSGAPWPRLQAGDGAVPLALRVALADFTLSADGSIGRTAGATGFDLALQARGDALALLRAAGDARPGRALPVDLAARLTLDGDGYAARDIRGRVLGVTLAGRLAYQRTTHALLSGALELGHLDLERLDLQAFEATGAPPPAAREAGAGVPPWLKDTEADLSLRVASIDGLSVPARDLAARLRWRDDALQLQGIAATLAGTQVRGDARIGWRNGRAQLDAKAGIALLDIGRLGGHAARRKRGAALDDPFPLASFRAFDARVQIDLARVAGAPLAIGNVAALARLQDGRLAVEVASATVAGIPLQGRIALDATGDAWRIDARAHAERIDLAALLRARDRPASASGVIQGTQAVFGSHGKSARAAGERDAVRAQRPLRPGSRPRPYAGLGGARAHRRRGGRPGAGQRGWQGIRRGNGADDHQRRSGRTG